MVLDFSWRVFPFELLSQSLTHDMLLSLYSRLFWWRFGSCRSVITAHFHEVTKGIYSKWFHCKNQKTKKFINRNKYDRSKYDRYGISGVIDGRNGDRVDCLRINTRTRLVFFYTQLFLQYSFSYCSCSLSFLLRVGGMAQANLMKAGSSNKGKDTLKPRLNITVARFDNSELIKGYSKTLIGRCMNPQKQDMKALLYMLPRIWHVERKVAAADLGLERFQFDFSEEQDIIEVLKMAPFHFDYWMLSVVRWQPVMDPQYPSEIMFWVRVLGVPLHYWAIPTFESIGDGIGEA